MPQTKRKQKTFWIPWKDWEEYEKDFAKNEKHYKMMGIKSVPELIRVLASMGRLTLNQLLAQLHATSELDYASIQDILAKLDKARRKTEE